MRPSVTKGRGGARAEAAAPTSSDGRLRPVAAPAGSRFAAANSRTRPGADHRLPVAAREICIDLGPSKRAGSMPTLRLRLPMRCEADRSPRIDHSRSFSSRARRRDRPSRRSTAEPTTTSGRVASVINVRRTASRLGVDDRPDAGTRALARPCDLALRAACRCNRRRAGRPDRCPPEGAPLLHLFALTRRSRRSGSRAPSGRVATPRRRHHGLSTDATAQPDVNSRPSRMAGSYHRR